MAGHRSNSQPQLHHDMDGQPVEGSSWDAPQRQASGGGGAGSGRAGSAGAGGSRLAHSASTGNAAFDGFEGAAPDPESLDGGAVACAHPAVHGLLCSAGL